jgi:hypothetical protein
MIEKIMEELALEVSYARNMKIENAGYRDCCCGLLGISSKTHAEY